MMYVCICAFTLPIILVWILGLKSKTMPIQFSSIVNQCVLGGVTKKIFSDNFGWTEWAPLRKHGKTYNNICNV